MCSRHFKNSHKRKLWLGEYPTENLPKLPTGLTPSKPRRKLVRRQPVQEEGHDHDQAGEYHRVEIAPKQDVGVNTDSTEFETLAAKVHDLEGEIKVMAESRGFKFSLESIASDDAKVMFYTGFPSYQLKKFFRLFGSCNRAVDIQRLKESI